MNTSDLRIADHPGRATTAAADLTFEPLGAQARGEILAHLRQLATADLNLRFSATMTEAALARYTDMLDFNRDSFVAARAGNGELTGIAQVCPQNTPMLAILRGAGMSIKREDCEMVGTLTITAARI